MLTRAFLSACCRMKSDLPLSRIGSQLLRTEQQTRHQSIASQRIASYSQQQEPVSDFKLSTGSTETPEIKYPIPPTKFLSWTYPHFTTPGEFYVCLGGQDDSQPISSLRVRGVTSKEGVSATLSLDCVNESTMLKLHQYLKESGLQLMSPTSYTEASLHAFYTRPDVIFNSLRLIEKHNKFDLNSVNILNQAREWVQAAQQLRLVGDCESGTGSAETPEIKYPIPSTLFFSWASDSVMTPSEFYVQLSGIDNLQPISSLRVWGTASEEDVSATLSIDCRDESTAQKLHLCLKESGLKLMDPTPLTKTSVNAYFMKPDVIFNSLKWIEENNKFDLNSMKNLIVARVWAQAASSFQSLSQDLHNKE